MNQQKLSHYGDTVVSKRWQRLGGKEGEIKQKTAGRWGIDREGNGER